MFRKKYKQEQNYFDDPLASPLVMIAEDRRTFNY